MRHALAPGSVLVLSHATDENRPEDAAKIVGLYRSTANPLRTRNRAEVAELFTGWDLVEHGLVWAPLWLPESLADVPDHPELSGAHASAGYKRRGRWLAADA